MPLDEIEKHDASDPVCVANVNRPNDGIALSLIESIATTALGKGPLVIREQTRGGLNCVYFLHAVDSDGSDGPCAVFRMQHRMSLSRLEGIDVPLPKLPGEQYDGVCQSSSPVGWLCSEISTIEYLSTLKEFPFKVAPVIAYDFRGDESNPLGRRFMIQEYVPGRTLKEVLGVDESKGYTLLEDDIDWSPLARAAAATQLELVDPKWLQGLPLRQAPDAHPGTHLRVQCSYLQGDHCSDVGHARSRAQSEATKEPPFYIERCNGPRSGRWAPVPSRELSSMVSGPAVSAVSWLEERWGPALDVWRCVAETLEAERVSFTIENFATARQRPMLVLSTAKCPAQLIHRLPNLAYFFAEDKPQNQNEIDEAVEEVLASLKLFNEDLPEIVGATLDLLRAYGTEQEKLQRAIFDCRTAGVATEPSGKVEGLYYSTFSGPGLSLYHQDLACRNMLFTEGNPPAATAVLDWTETTVAPWPFCVSHPGEFQIDPICSAIHIPRISTRSSCPLYPCVKTKREEKEAFESEFPGWSYCASFLSRQKAACRLELFKTWSRTLMLERVKTTVKASTGIEMTTDEEELWSRKIDAAEALADLVERVESLPRLAYRWETNHRRWAEKQLRLAREALSRVEDASIELRSSERLCTTK